MMGMIHIGLDIVLLLMIAIVLMKLDAVQQVVDRLAGPGPDAQEQPAEEAPESAA